MAKFRSCPSCRGAAKLTITVPCPECEGRGTIEPMQMVGKLGDLLSEDTIAKLAELLAEDDRSGVFGDA